MSNRVTVDGPDAITAFAAEFFEVYHSIALVTCVGSASFRNPLSFTRAEVSEMRLVAVAAIAVAVGASAQAAQEPDRRVTVYFRDNPSVPDPVRSIARALASDMFAGIGVRIDWRSGLPASSSPHGAIAIELVTETPGTFLPGALAYAQPYEGVHIQVFYDRIKYKPAPAELLAHVMVHEITHVLQGISRHSDSGIMKANWGGDDFQRMRYKALPFTEEDVVLTHRGLKMRNFSATARLSLVSLAR